MAHREKLLTETFVALADAMVESLGAVIDVFQCDKAARALQQ